jgi:hypothetical protein
MRSPAIQVKTKTQPVTRVITLTPELAKQYLEKAGPNRKTSERHIQRLARDMKAGAWQLNGETIKVDTNGEVLDGQHRLWAVLISETPIQTFITEGLDPTTMTSIDTGRNRSFANVLQISGTGPGATTLAAALRMWWLYENDMLHAGSTMFQPSHADLQDVLNRHPTLPQRVEEYQSSTARKLGAPAALVFVYSGAYEIDPEKAQAWFNAVASGAGLDEANPAFRLRERLLMQRVKPGRQRAYETAGIVIKSWNAWYDGRAMHRVAYRMRSDERFPRFSGAETENN